MSRQLRVVFSTSGAGTIAHPNTKKRIKIEKAKRRRRRERERREGARGT